jgi:hypothetical protein
LGKIAVVLSPENTLIEIAQNTNCVPANCAESQDDLDRSAERRCFPVTAHPVALS